MTTKKKPVSLTPDERDTLRNDIRKYYHREDKGIDFILEKWPQINRDYLLKRANDLGYKLPMHEIVKIHKERSRKAKARKNPFRPRSVKDDFTPSVRKITYPTELEILALHTSWK